MFEIAFTDCENDFRREIIRNCKFEFCYCSDQIAREEESLKWP